MKMADLDWQDVFRRMRRIVHLFYDSAAVDDVVAAVAHDVPIIRQLNAQFSTFEMIKAGPDRACVTLLARDQLTLLLALREIELESALQAMRRERAAAK